MTSVDQPITSFSGANYFLSNFYPVPAWGGRTVEHYFQAAKSLDTEEQAKVLAAASPSEAKKLGSKGGVVTLREDWETVKFQVMSDYVALKFKDVALAHRLRATGTAFLLEGNTWNDKEWGAVLDSKGVWQGKNYLGVILTSVRSVLNSQVVR